MQKTKKKAPSKESLIASEMYTGDAQRLSQSYLVSPIITPKTAGVLVFDLFPVLEQKDGEGTALWMDGNWRVLKAVPDGDVALLHHYPYAIQPYTLGPVTFRMMEYGVTKSYHLVCTSQYPCLGYYHDGSPALVETEVLPCLTDGPKKEAARKVLEVLCPEGKVREVSWRSYEKPRGSSSYSSTDILEIENALAGLTLLSGSEANRVLKGAVEAAADL